MATLTASSAMRQALKKAVIPAPRHAVHKSPIGAAKATLLGFQMEASVAQKATPAPEMHPSPIVDEDPAIMAYRRARADRRNALFLKLRQLSPALFARKEAPAPMMVGIFDAIVSGRSTRFGRNT